MAKPFRPFALVRPCANCPFRTDVAPFLRPERVAQIATDVQGGSTFHCHQTTVPSEDGVNMDIGPDSAACAGSLILMEKAGTPNQMMRIGERMGFYDPERVDLDAPVYDSWVAMQDAAARAERGSDDGEEEGDPCGVCGPECEAPAGYMVNGAVVRGTEYAEGECWECGTIACGACLVLAARNGDDVLVCLDCEEDHES